MGWWWWGGGGGGEGVIKKRFLLVKIKYTVMQINVPENVLESKLTSLMLSID